MKKLSFQELLDSTKRIQYTEKEIVESVKTHKPQDIEFFKLDKYVSDDQLEVEYVNRGLVPAHPYALILYSKDYEEEIDKKLYVCTHWKDSNGKWCYAAFVRWHGERSVYVYRYDFGWYGYWWFAGLRKYPELGTSKPLNKPLESLNFEISEIRVNGKRYKLID